jgi:CRP-like cAMP-binding protein
MVSPPDPRARTAFCVFPRSAELALMVGAKRVAVSRAMKGLREAGAVETGRRHIVVKDAETLGRIADEVP